jgi:hypothetical protein
MATSSHPVETAKIYQFPARGRFAVRFAKLGETEAAASAPSLAAQGVGDIVFGSSWYHEEAVQEERARSPLL